MDAEYNAENDFTPLDQRTKEEIARQMKESLGPSQRSAYDMIWTSLLPDTPADFPRLFRLDGEAGCGESIGAKPKLPPIIITSSFRKVLPHQRHHRQL
jgi:hypothetical protein